MEGFQLKPQHTLEEFTAAAASNFKSLPPSWTFRIKTLEQDMTEVPENGVPRSCRTNFSTSVARPVRG
jgi:hypothetical protein